MAFPGIAHTGYIDIYVDNTSMYLKKNIIFKGMVKNIISWVRKMAQESKAHAIDPGDLRSISRTCVLEGENQFLLVVF